MCHRCHEMVEFVSRQSFRRRSSGVVSIRKNDVEKEELTNFEIKLTVDFSINHLQQKRKGLKMKLLIIISLAFGGNLNENSVKTQPVCLHQSLWYPLKSEWGLEPRGLVVEVHVYVSCHLNAIPNLI